jgi:hypothetical protein
MKVEYGFQLRPAKGWLVCAASDLAGRRCSGLTLALAIKPTTYEWALQSAMSAQSVRHLPEVELCRA